MSSVLGKMVIGRDGPPEGSVRPKLCRPPRGGVVKVLLLGKPTWIQLHWVRGVTYGHLDQGCPGCQSPHPDERDRVCRGYSPGLVLRPCPAGGHTWQREIVELPIAVYTLGPPREAQPDYHRLALILGREADYGRQSASKRTVSRWTDTRIIATAPVVLPWAIEDSVARLFAWPGLGNRDADLEDVS
jgi:hypothetical protein